MKLHEKFAKKLTEIRGNAVSFRIDRVRLPNGRHAVREYLDHPGAVAVVPLIGRDKVVLVRQYRHPVGQLTWEIPAGKLAKNENPLACVKRELHEETGYSAASFQRLLSFWPTPAFANEVIHIYLAKGLTKGTAHLDDDEFLSAKIWPLKKVFRAIWNGEIKDSKTLIALLSYGMKYA